jgi:transcriptional regulator with XRE-family HTH domain
VHFKTLREQRKRTLDDLSRVLGKSASQVSRLDTGARTYQADDVETLADWYDLDAAERGMLLALADEAQRRAWWQQVELPDAYRTYIGMERRAVQISEYCSAVMPGLLQTRAYAEAAVAASVVDADRSTIESAADVRVRRQDILQRPEPPRVRLVLDEVVLARGVKPHSVMREQLERLYSAATEHNSITVQVIDFEYGLHPGPYGHLIILDMPDPLPDVRYFEDRLAYGDTANPAEVAEARRTWDSLQAVALSPRASLDRIKRYL